ncbi:Transcription factor MYB48 [Quillaja saponaria]|uniref:Transcription factor MYB48 n=1 Tax=Quillaja saponaria TaxID=32244 RepID=A0AAD7Q431_QUISA|nr:Transcription factor MYB48 [Quillaja saponaria]
MGGRKVLGLLRKISCLMNMSACMGRVDGVLWLGLQKQKSSQKQEKRKAQMLKHKEQQQQQQQQAEEYDMNMIIPENSTVEQEKQEIVYMYPTTDIEDRWFGFMDQESDSVGDDALWDSLWNLDEVPYGMAMQNQVRTTFGTDGTYKNHYF